MGVLLGVLVASPWSWQASLPSVVTVPPGDTLRVPSAERPSEGARAAAEAVEFPYWIARQADARLSAAAEIPVASRGIESSRGATRRWARLSALVEGATCRKQAQERSGRSTVSVSGIHVPGREDLTILPRPFESESARHAELAVRGTYALGQDALLERIDGHRVAAHQFGAQPCRTTFEAHEGFFVFTCVSFGSNGRFQFHGVDEDAPWLFDATTAFKWRRVELAKMRGESPLTFYESFGVDVDAAPFDPASCDRYQRGTSVMTSIGGWREILTLLGDDVLWQLGALMETNSLRDQRQVFVLADNASWDRKSWQRGLANVLSGVHAWIYGRQARFPQDMPQGGCFERIIWRDAHAWDATQAPLARSETLVKHQAAPAFRLLTADHLAAIPDRSVAPIRVRVMDGPEQAYDAGELASALRSAPVSRVASGALDVATIDPVLFRKGMFAAEKFDVGRLRSMCQDVDILVTTPSRAIVCLMFAPRATVVVLLVPPGMPMDDVEQGMHMADLVGATPVVVRTDNRLNWSPERRDRGCAPLEDDRVLRERYYNGTATVLLPKADGAALLDRAVHVWLSMR